ncbi:MAG: hypothetical protein ACKO85_02040 [Isosphaeraceae bacterium]
MSSDAGFGRFLLPTAILLSSFFTSVSSAYGWQAGEQAPKAEAVAASPKLAAAAPTTQEQIDALMKLVRSQVETVEELKRQNQQLQTQNAKLGERLREIDLKISDSNTLDNQTGKAQATAPPANPAALPPLLPETAGNVVPTPVSDADEPMGLPDDVAPINAMQLQAGAALANTPVIEGSPLKPHLPADIQPAQPGLAPGSAKQDFLVGRYDNGFILTAPKNPADTPFALRLNIVSQERYTGFSRNVEGWQPHNFKEVIPVNQRSTFDINRAYIGFSGFALSPKLQYSFILATTSTRNVSYVLAVMGYQFSKKFGLYGGYNKVPGTREWFESFKNTMGVDRSMATTFIRPSMSPGVWITGEPLENFHYYAMISNSMNSLSQITDRTSNQMTYSANVWWEPLGVFGPGFADVEYHENPAIRLGTTTVYDRIGQEPFIDGVIENPENTITRLSNGLPLFLPGAVAPGVTIEAASNFLWTIDAGLKYRGFALTGEYYFRWLNNFSSNGPLGKMKSVYDQAGYLQMSYAVIPKKLELYARSSLIAGPFGSGNEYGGGLNWYVQESRKWRVSGEVLQLNRSPASNILTGYRVGESGTLFQLQLLTDF